MAEVYKPKERRKKAPVKRVAVSAEAKAAYEATIREREAREKDHTQFLPEDMKGKR